MKTSNQIPTTALLNLRERERDTSDSRSALASPARSLPLDCRGCTETRVDSVTVEQNAVNMDGGKADCLGKKRRKPESIERQ